MLRSKKKTWSEPWSEYSFLVIFHFPQSALFTLFGADLAPGISVLLGIRTGGIRGRTGVQKFYKHGDTDQNTTLPAQNGEITPKHSRIPEEVRLKFSFA